MLTLVHTNFHVICSYVHNRHTHTPNLILCPSTATWSVIGPDRYLSYCALFCRFSGVEAFALDSRRFKNFTLGRGAGGGGYTYLTSYLTLVTLNPKP